MNLVLYESEQDRNPLSAQTTWQELARDLIEFRRCSCTVATCLGRDCAEKRGPAWSPIEVIPGGRRRLEDVAAVTMAVYDLDHLPEAVLEGVVDRITTAGLAAIIHSTHSHRPPEDCCARLVLPLSRPALPAEWPRLRAAIEAKLDLRSDPKAKDASRLFFLPSAPSDALPLGGTLDGNTVPVDQWLAEAPATAPATPKLLASARPTLEPGGEDIGALRERLKKVTKAESKALVKLVLKGKPFAKEGERDDLLNKIVGILAFELPEASDAALMEILRESVLAMPGDPPPGAADWMPLAQYKLGRARERKAAEDAKQAEDKEKLLNVLRRQAAASNPKPAVVAVEAGGESVQMPTGDNYGSYSLEEIAEWSEEQGCAVEDFPQRLIIQIGRSYWVFVDGKYQNAIGADDLAVSLPRDLIKAFPKYVSLIIPTKEGSRPIKVLELLRNNATVARKLSASLSLQKSYYDAKTQEFNEAVCPLRNIKPVEHPEIHRWLTLLGGDSSEKLLDWVATAPNLKRQSCALFFKAGTGYGKTLFAHGLAKLWTTGSPTALEDVFSGFNAALANCPLTFADEKLPNVKDITSELRRFIGSTTRPLNRKFMATANLDGAVRLIIAANNSRVFDKFSEELDDDDLKALEGRFLYIQSNPEAKAYIESFPVEVRDTWRTQDKIAEHAMWLRDTRVVDVSGRFLVTGESSEFHDHLANQGLAGAVCEWLTKHLLFEGKAGSVNPLHVLIGEGEIWVNAAAFLDDIIWFKRVPSMKYLPNLTQFGRSLSGMSIKQRVRVKVGDAQITYHRVSVDRLCAWVVEAGIGDVDLIREKLNIPNSVMAKSRAVRGETPWSARTDEPPPNLWSVQ